MDHQGKLIRNFEEQATSSASSSHTEVSPPVIGPLGGRDLSLLQRESNRFDQKLQEVRKMWGIATTNEERLPREDISGNEKLLETVQLAISPTDTQRPTTISLAARTCETIDEDEELASDGTNPHLEDATPMDE